MLFFPRKINFRWEGKEDKEKVGKNTFQIDIIFPLKKANLKQCSFEIFYGCYHSDEISDVELNSLTYYHNYKCYLEQNNIIISFKSLKDKSILYLNNNKWIIDKEIDSKTINNSFEDILN